MKRIITLLIILIPIITKAQTASQMVLLESIGVKDSPDPKEALAFFRIKYENGLLDPTSGTFGYTAPVGKALIITEADWQYASGKAGENVTLRIFLMWPGDRGLSRRALESTILLGSSGGGGTSTVERTGIVVPRGVKIIVDVIGSGATGKIQHVLLRGYLTDAIK